MLPPMEIFAGPCVLESEQLAMNVAEKLATVGQEFQEDITITFKGSFDKANRTSVESYRGPGLEEGLRLLEKVRETFALPVLTDFHVPSQAKEVAPVVDVLQIPAFLCRQTDMIVEGARACQKYSRRLKVKKGQFIAPEQTKYIVEKATHFIPKSDLLLTERGSCFGYGRLIVDMTSFNIMKSFGVKTVHDATHSVQRPKGGVTGGQPDQILTLAMAAIAAGADAVFMETHPNPSQALSDAATQLPLNQFKNLISHLLNIYQSVALTKQPETTD